MHNRRNKTGGKRKRENGKERYQHAVVKSSSREPRVKPAKKKIRDR
jgi:hypothetical protein